LTKKKSQDEIEFDRFIQKTEDWDNYNPILRALFSQVQELSKKKPDEALNLSKIKMINELLQSVFSILDDEPSRRLLAQLDEVSLPSNSDAVFMLAQVVAAMDRFHTRFNYYADGFHGWHETPKEEYDD
jgi:hypothetical protein